MSSKRKLKAKIDRLKTALRKSEVEMKLLRSDFLVDIERLAYNLHFSEGQVQVFIRDNRMLRDRLQAFTTEKTDVSKDAQGVVNPDAANYTCIGCKDSGFTYVDDITSCDKIYCTCLAGRTLLQNERRGPEKIKA